MIVVLRVTPLAAALLLALAATVAAAPRPEPTPDVSKYDDNQMAKASRMCLPDSRGASSTWDSDALRLGLHFPKVPPHSAFCERVKARLSTSTPLPGTSSATPPTTAPPSPTPTETPAQ